MTGLPPRVWPAFALAAIAAWQFATVSANYGGNPSALFCTGALRPQPQLVRDEGIYIFPNSTGYDGQQYHLIAHDPFLRTELRDYVDAPRLRYRRILLPLTVYVLSLGIQSHIDWTYYVVCLLILGLGAWWCCGIAIDLGVHPAWSLIYLAIPAVPITADREVLDGLLLTLTAGFIYYLQRRSFKLFLVLAAAGLTREIGFFLIGAAVIHFAVRRDFRRAAIACLCAFPAFAWYAYVQAHTAPQPLESWFVPFSSILHVLSHPWPYPPGTPFAGVVVAADYLALAGILVAAGCSFLVFARDPRDGVRLAAVFFGLTVIVVQPIQLWQNAYDYGRVFSPLLLCLAVLGAGNRRPWLIAPIAMVFPRIAMQFAPQLLGILHKI